MPVPAGRIFPKNLSGLWRGFVFWIWFPAAGWAAGGLHSHILVFVPESEGSALYDPQLAEPGEEAPCVWGATEALRRLELYYALRMPNRLVTKLGFKEGALDAYRPLAEALTHASDDIPDFAPYTEGADFFFFAYDWRQELGSVTAPALGRALNHYADIYAAQAQRPADQARFVIVAHGMGGLVVRTLLSQDPRLAQRIERLYLVGTPNLGSAKAIKTLVEGPGGLKENPISGWLGFSLNFLPNEVDVATTRLVAITFPSLYEQLPIQDPRWEEVNGQGNSSRVAAEDLLNVGTWRSYWPSPEMEQQRYLQPWRNRFMGLSGESTDPRNWEYCQDPNFKSLQDLLVKARDWRLLVGSLAYTKQLLTEPEKESRLRVVAGVGLQTPTGVITQGDRDNTEARFTYGGDTDGDGVVTVVSALDDIPDSFPIVRLPAVPHAGLASHLRFLNYLRQDLIPLQKIIELRRTEPDTRPAEETPALLP